MIPFMLRCFFVLCPLLLCAGDAVPPKAPKPAASPLPTENPPEPSLPALLPGESLVLCDREGHALATGEADKVTPLGGLAKLLWLRLEGDEWGALGVEFKCRGSWQGQSCGCTKGHGKLDLQDALRKDCDLAFLAWAQMSDVQNKRLYGEGPQQARMAEVFDPFLGKGFVWGSGAPPVTMAWMGRGALLQSSPKALAAWLADIHQESLINRCRRYLLGFIGSLGRQSTWWTLSTLADTPDAAWVVGGDGHVIVVFRKRGTRDKEAATARLKQLLKLPQ